MNEAFKDNLSWLQVIVPRYLGIDPDECTGENYIDQLEALVSKANRYAARGEQLFDDSIYDAVVDFLREVNPDSPVLKQVWSEDVPSNEVDTDLDRFLMSCPMMSIRTIKDINCADVDNFINLLPDNQDIEFHMSMKENGHGIRICVSYGYIVKAYSRGRSTNGRDLTRQVQNIFGGDNLIFPDVADYPLIELRGEVCLPFSNMSKAREFNPEIKSPFTGVSSMLRDSASVEENQLLKFIAYDVMGLHETENGLEELQFEKLSDKFKFLESNMKLETPGCMVVPVNKQNFKQQILQYMDYMDKCSKDYDFYTDGVVGAVNSLTMFQSMGQEDKYRLGNLAFKIGRWKQDVYTGVVLEILWKAGKTKLTPVARVGDVDTHEEGVITATGNTVRNVPLYAPCYILALEAYIGEVINFKYGGEAGVVPCYPDGVLVTDKDAMDVKVLCCSFED